MKELHFFDALHPFLVLFSSFFNPEDPYNVLMDSQQQ